MLLLVLSEAWWQGTKMTDLWTRREFRFSSVGCVVISESNKHQGGLCLLICQSVWLA